MLNLKNKRMNAIIVSALLGVVMMFTGIVVKKSQSIQTIAIFGILVLLGVTIFDYTRFNGNSQSFYNMIEMNSFTAWFNVLITACAAVYFILFHKQIARVGKNDADYFALLYFILTGVFLLSSYTHLLILFIGIEVLSIPQYILAGSDKENIKSNEASLKYFLMGSFSTGILLMAIALLYGATGSFDMLSESFAGQFIQSGQISSLAIAGILLLIVALGFKVSAAPMHFWTPDVYDGSPTAFTPFMATITKVAVFISFIRIFHFSFGSIGSNWQITIAIMIALTLFIGNITAVYQTSVKRMMAYSSVAQAGFMLFAIFAVNATSWKGITLYSVAYTLASLGVFAVIIRLKDYTYDGFNGLGKKHPVLAITATICLLSLAGIPLTGGFFAKYYVLMAAIEQGNHLWLVIFAVLMAAISAYYYFRVIMSMYFKEGEASINETPSVTEQMLLIANAIVVIVLGILPTIVMK